MSSVLPTPISVVSIWSGHPDLVTLFYHCPPTLTPSFRALRTCNWKLLPLLPPLCADPCHLPPWHHQPGMHCHTPNRNASLLLEIHTDTRSPEGPWRSRGSLRLGAHESTGVPWLSGSTSSTSPTARSGPHTRKLHRPPGLTHYDIYAPGGNNQHSCLVRQTWVSVPASVSDTC